MEGLFDFVVEKNLAETRRGEFYYVRRTFCGEKTARSFLSESFLEQLAEKGSFRNETQIGSAKRAVLLLSRVVQLSYLGVRVISIAQFFPTIFLFFNQSY